MSKTHTLARVETQGDRARWVCACGSRGIFLGGILELSASKRAEHSFTYHAGSAWNEDGTVRE